VPLAEGRRLVKQFEDKLEDMWLWDTYKTPGTPGSGTLFMRNPPAPTHRVKYILNYGRPGYDPVIGPSYSGPLKPGETQYKPAMKDYNDIVEGTSPWVTAAEHAARHLEKKAVPPPSA